MTEPLPPRLVAIMDADYPGQVLRSFALAEEPSPLYRDLHAVADAAFDAIAAIVKDGTTPAEVVAPPRA